ASRRFTIEDIARMFNVSPIFLQEYSNSTYSNFSEASRAFLTMTMLSLIQSPSPRDWCYDLVCPLLQ
ncbi:phage portal protein, partial [Enterobacter hormaechei]